MARMDRVNELQQPGEVKAHVEIYSDGACRGNPGPGGWGTLLRMNQHERELRGSERLTTNNRMEMTAALEGLKALTRSCRVDVYTDSRYLCDGMSSWMSGWKRKGWLKVDSTQIKNVDLWLELDRLSQKHEVLWHWVRGHAGHVDNERVDRLANRAIDELLRGGA